MSKRKWHIKVFYLGIALAMAVGLLLTPAVTPTVGADPDLSEWGKVTTPSEDDWVVAPESDFNDMGAGVGAGGLVLYVTGNGHDVDDLDDDGNETEVVQQLWKSTDGGATWKALTDNVIDELVEEGFVADVDEDGVIDDMSDVGTLNRVKAAGDNADLVLVSALLKNKYATYGGYDLKQVVLISEDGGDTFKFTGDIVDAGEGTVMSEIYHVAISPEVDGDRYIIAGGICGTIGSSVGVVYRLPIEAFGGWEDVTGYDGWDITTGGVDVHSVAVTEVAFAPSYPTDYTVLVISHSASATYLQSGSWGKGPAWNDDADFAPAVEVIDDPGMWDGTNYGAMLNLKGGAVGLCLPRDYEGRRSNKRYAWVYVDQTDGDGVIYRVKDGSSVEIDTQIEDNPYLGSLSFMGTIDEGKAIAGLVGKGAIAFTKCCDGVQVYRVDTCGGMQICCPDYWKEACKPPTGNLAAGVSYVGLNKAVGMVQSAGGYDESAFSVSYDDGDTWNQISLIDTHIDLLSDVAKSPDCNKTLLVSINGETGCACDSVWLKAEELEEAEEYSGKWMRVWCGELENGFGLLRLAPEEDEGYTVYLVDRGTDTVYYNGSEGMACWEEGHAKTIDEIADLAVKDEAIIYALEEDGRVATSDDHGSTATWEDPVDGKADDGWTIAVLGDNILVGGTDGKVSYSDDAGESFSKLDDIGDGYVTVAFDSYFDENYTIYAAIIDACEGTGDNGIYRWVIDESDEFEDLDAKPYGYTGLVLERAGGNPNTDADTGGVLYASYVIEEDGEVVTGAARCLTPAEEFCCGEADWDYLVEGLTVDEEAFYLMPKALKICGCLTEDSSTELFAIDGIVDDGPGYDMEKGEDGTVWGFEDCYSKKTPELASPADGVVIDSMPCECKNDSFNLAWTRPCDACVYELQLAGNPDFTVSVIKYEVERGKVNLYGVGGDDSKNPSTLIGSGKIDCAKTLFWRVRVCEAETGQVIHSPWSAYRSFSIAQGPLAAIDLTAPDDGASNVPVAGVGFTWTSVAKADGYDFVLSKNADLSGPVVTKTGLKGTAYNHAGPLDYEEPYYWQVTAKKGSIVLSTSSVSTFTTASAPLPPAEKPAPPKTPAWVWVVIGIGAVLVIVVIVLIFRTRRV